MRKFIICVIFFKNYNDRDMINYWCLTEFILKFKPRSITSAWLEIKICACGHFFHPHHYLVSRNVGNGFMVNLTWNERGRNFYFRMMLNVQCSTLTFLCQMNSFYWAIMAEREREAKTASFAQNGKLDNPSQEKR